MAIPVKDKKGKRVYRYTMKLSEHSVCGSHFEEPIKDWLSNSTYKELVDINKGVFSVLSPIDDYARIVVAGSSGRISKHYCLYGIQYNNEHPHLAFQLSDVSDSSELKPLLLNWLEQKWFHLQPFHLHLVPLVECVYDKCIVMHYAHEYESAVGQFVYELNKSVIELGELEEHAIVTLKNNLIGQCLIKNIKLKNELSEASYLLEIKTSGLFFSGPAEEMEKLNKSIRNRNYH